MTRLPLTHVIFLLLLGSDEGVGALQPHERNLKLQCAPGITKTYDEQGDLEIPESRFAFLSFGNEGRKLIKMFRRRDESYYFGVVNQIIMATCDVQKKEQDRCVPATSEFAAKDWNNTCIQAAGYSCDEGMCERTSDCFWDKVKEGKVRSSRFTKEEYDSSKDKLYGLSRESYVGDVATLTIVGFIFSIAFFVIWLIYFIGRYFCCCFWTSYCCKPCSPIPKLDGYNVLCQWVFPSVIYFGGFVGMIISGFIAIIGNEDINVAAAASFAYISLLIDNLGIFLVSSSIPLNELKNIVEGAADDAFKIFDGTDYVRSTATEIVDSFVDFMDLHVLGLSGNEQALTGVKEAFSANVEPVVDQIQAMLDTLENDLYDGSDLINETLSTVVSQIGSFKDNTDVWQKNVTDYEQAEDGTRALRQGAILSLFVIGATICLLGFIGIIHSRRPKCHSLYSLINLTGIVSAIMGSGCLVVASFTLLISFLWHDACEISRLVVRDFEPVLGETLARGANAIFDGNNLAVAFNVTDKIDFEEKLNEGLAEIENVNITEQFQFVVSPLEDMQDTVVNPVRDATFNTLNSSELTGINVPGECTFDYQWRRTGWDDMIEPWMRTLEINGLTSWPLNSTGNLSPYDRVGDEGPEEYIDRIYSIAGKCEKSSGECCLNNVCFRLQNEVCNSGSNCKRNEICSQTSRGIREVFEKVSSFSGGKGDMTFTF
jgi:hypothetical protein